MVYNPEKLWGQTLDARANSTTDKANETNIVWHGKVVNIDDNRNSKRIQVRIEGFDSPNLADSDLPWCVSMMPNFFYCLPQVGEHVLVMFMNPWAKSYTRLYMGPLQAGNNGEQQYT